MAHRVGSILATGVDEWTHDVVTSMRGLPVTNVGHREPVAFSRDPRRRSVYERTVNGIEAGRPLGGLVLCRKPRSQHMER